MTVNEGDVGLADLAGREKLSELCMGGVVFGDDDEAACLLVETMDDARTKFTAGRGKRVEAEQERIDEGVAVAGVFGFAGTGVHHHACGLVDDGEVFVFIDNVERY